MMTQLASKCTLYSFGCGKDDFKHPSPQELISELRKVGWCGVKDVCYPWCEYGNRKPSLQIRFGSEDKVKAALGPVQISGKDYLLEPLWGSGPVRNDVQCKRVFFSGIPKGADGLQAYLSRWASS